MLSIEKWRKTDEAQATTTFYDQQFFIPVLQAYVTYNDLK